MTSHDTDQPASPTAGSRSRDNLPLAWKCNPGVFLHDPDSDSEAVIACIKALAPDRKNPPPPLDSDFVRLMKLWGIIARPYRAGPYPRFDMGVLRWLLDGRVREAITFLCRQNDPQLWQALDKLEKMANFGCDGKPAAVGLATRRLFGWFRYPLIGNRASEERVAICKPAGEFPQGDEGG